MNADACNMVNKVPVHHYPKLSAEDRYLNLLTPYAATFVLENLEEAKNLEDINADLVVTSNNCSCYVQANMKLPCKHIFYKRMLNNEELYDESLINVKFTRKYYITTQIHAMEQPYLINENATETEIHQVITSHKRILSGSEKYKKIMRISEEIGSFSSEYENTDFNHILEQLKIFREYVQNRKKILVIEDTSINDINEDIMNSTTNELLINVCEETEPCINDLNKFIENSTNEINVCKETLACTSNLDEVIQEQTMDELFTNVSEETMSNTICTLNYDNQIQAEHDYCAVEPKDDKKVFVELKDIKINPLKMKRIGRPKGVDTTVIGLKRTRMKAKQK